MKTEDNPKAYELLGEIAMLLRKYGQGALLDLATIMRNPHFTDQLATVLENTAKVAPPRKQTKTRASLKQEQQQLRESLAALRETEPDRANILLSLLNSLQTKTILPSLRALSAFISDQGLPVPKAKSRDKVALWFLRQCTRLAIVDLQALAQKVALAQGMPDGDRSLAGWGRIILDGKEEKD
jgi:hypothetical protein